MMAIPVTRESLRWIVHRFESEKFVKAWMAGFNLRARRPAVICKVVAASESDREVDQSPENALRGREASRCMRDTKIENDTCLRLSRPNQEAFFIPLDEPNGAVDHRDGAAEFGFLPVK